METPLSYNKAITLHMTTMPSPISFKVNRYPFRGSNSIFIFVSHLLRGQFLKKRIYSLQSKFFLLRIDLILKGLHCPGKQKLSHKSCFPLFKIIENHKGVLIHLNTRLHHATSGPGCSKLTTSLVND